VPWILRRPIGWQIRRTVLNGIWSGGIGRFSREEIHALVDEAVENLATKFADGRLYFHNSKNLTEIDIILYSFLVSSFAIECNPYFNGLLIRHTVLIHYTLRLTKALFPEYKEVLAKLEAATQQNTTPR